MAQKFLIKTADLIGPALDWAVAIASGWRVYPTDSIEQGGVFHCDTKRAPFGSVIPVKDYHPSTNWSQGGPIIERCEIGVRRYLPAFKGGGWEATPSISAKGAGGRSQDGPTPLIAAMRCYVASNLGEEVDIPEELL
jgi:hypothetical protein